MTTNNEENNLTKLRNNLISHERSHPKAKNGIYIHEIIAEGKTICQKSEAKKYVLWSSDNEEIDTAYLILVGETGKGKTTLINGILNFITGIDYRDAYRLSVPVYNSSANKSITESQTELLTVYNLPYVDGMAHKSNLVLIDTPGVLDTHGPGYEKLNLDRIKLFLKEQIPMENNFTGIVAEANLTNTASVDSLMNGIKYIVDDESTKTVLIATFADASKPKAFSTLEKLNMKFYNKFPINNGFIFTSNVDDLQEKWTEWKDQITDLMACIMQTPKDSLGIALSHEEMNQSNCIHLERLDLEKRNKENKVMKMLKSIMKKVHTPKDNQSLTEISTGDKEENFSNDELNVTEQFDEKDQNIDSRDINEYSRNEDSGIEEEYEAICKATFKLTGEKYNEQLGDKNSTAFAIKRKEVEDLIEDAFRRDGGKKYFKNAVKEFSRGSVIVVSEITTREEDGIADIDSLTKVIKESGINGLDQSSVTVYGTQAIHWISYGGHLDLLKDLVDLGKDIRAQDELNRTPLHRAAEGNHKEICEWLLDNGSMPDLDHKDDSGYTPADEATFFNHSELASWLKKVQMTDKLRTALKDEVKDERQISSLLNSGADPNIIDKLGFPALVNAAMHSPALVSLFLEAGADVNTKTRKGERAVHWASYYGRLDVLQLLMDNKANLRVQDNYSMTSLHWAKLGNQNEACEWLLKQKNIDLDLSHKDDFDRTPTDWAEEVRNINISAWLREDAEADIASTSTEEQICSHLTNKRNLEPGQDKPQFNEDAEADIASTSTEEQICSHLTNKRNLEPGQDKPQFNENAEADVASTSTQEQICSHLTNKRNLEPGQDKPQFNEAAEADVASTSTQEQICSLLTKKRKHELGQDTAQFNEEDSNSLHKAACIDDQDCVQNLINKGTADVNWKGIGGATPLHYACLRGNSPIVLLLISAGADIEAKNNRGSTPLKYAQQHGQKQIIEILTRVES